MTNFIKNLFGLHIQKMYQIAYSDGNKYRFISQATGDYLKREVERVTQERPETGIICFPAWLIVRLNWRVDVSKL